jgi:general secretion pathway protein F
VPVYIYRGMTSDGHPTRGNLDAESLGAARSKLRSQGIFPTEISEGRTQSASSDVLEKLRLPTLRRVPDLELALFSNQLSTLQSAGVPLVESLSALTEQIENARLKAICGKLREEVNQGRGLADAMADHPQPFDLLYRSMVRAGESSGALALVLRQLGSYVERRLELRNQITSAMIYPALMLVVSAAVLGFLLVGVIPDITALLEDLDQELPWLTVLVISLSEFLRAWWLPAVVVLGGGTLVLMSAIRTERGRYTWDRLRLDLPVAGRLLRYVAIARFTRTLATLLSGGVDIVQALDIAKSVSGNSVIARAVEDVRDSITKGASIAATLRQSGEFPPIVTHMVAVGEASGELDAMLAKVADTFDELVENALARLTAVMGPVLLLIVAGVVVVVILSTLLPLMDLTSAL